MAWFLSVGGDGDSYDHVAGAGCADGGVAWLGTGSNVSSSCHEILRGLLSWCCWDAT